MCFKVIIILQIAYIKAYRRHSMNKTELIDAIAKKADISKKDAEGALKATIESIESALAAGDKVTLVGFGTFEVKERAAREGRNPATGETIKIKASKVPAFKAGKDLKEKVNSKKKSKK